MVPACPAAWHARPSSSSSEVNPGAGSPGGPAGPVGPVDPTGPGSPWMLQTSGRSLRRQASSGAETRRRPSFSRAHAVIVVVSSPARAAMIVPPANTSAVGTSRASHESRIAPPVRVSSPNVYARGGRPASVRAGFGALSARLRDCELLLAPGAEIHRHERDGLAAEVARRRVELHRRDPDLTPGSAQHVRAVGPRGQPGRDGMRDAELVARAEEVLAH